MSDPARRAVERHLVASSPLLEEVGLVGPLDGCVALVVPRAAALSAQQVLVARARVSELLHAAAPTSPQPVRFARVTLAPGPLPRGPDGDLALDAPLAAPRADGPPDGPAARHLLARLPEVLGVPGPLSPGQRLDDELGVDSLGLMQLRALLEVELGVRLADDELWRLETIGDLLRRVARADVAAASRRLDPTWSARLREPVVGASLDARFNLRRRGLHHAAARLGMGLLRVAARALFRLEVVHRERLPRRGPYLLCPTHQSLLDSPLIYAAFPPALVDRTLFIAFGPYFRAAPLSWLVRMGRLILTGEGGSLTDSLRLGLDGLRRGLVVCIFPEGSCSWSGEVLPARPGVGLLACEAQVPIVPVLYEGSGRTCSPLHPGLRRTKIRLVVGEPIPPPAPRAFARADYQALADRWREAVVTLGVSRGARGSRRGTERAARPAGPTPTRPHPP